jgi:drug/metabolite transporter (DMT)-like permease
VDSALAALGAAALWGGMYVVSKDTFAEIPPVTLGALRLMLGGAALAVVLKARGQFRWPGDRRLLVAGVLLAGTLIVQFVGTDLATASEGALLTTTTPLFIVPLAWGFLGERPTSATLAGIAVGMVGVALAVGGGVSFARSPWGPILLLASAAGWAGYTIASAPAARREGPLVAVTWATLIAIPIVATLSVLEMDRWRAAPYAEAATLAAVGYLGLAASAGAWYLWNRGVAGLPAAVAGAFFFVQPVVGGVLARLLLGERLDLAFAAGGVLILGGVMLALRSTEAHRERAPAAPPQPKEAP